MLLCVPFGLLCALINWLGVNMWCECVCASVTVSSLGLCRALATIYDRPYAHCPRPPKCRFFYILSTSLHRHCASVLCRHNSWLRWPLTGFSADHSCILWNRCILRPIWYFSSPSTSSSVVSFVADTCATIEPKEHNRYSTTHMTRRQNGRGQTSIEMRNRKNQ